MSHGPRIIILTAMYNSTATITRLARSLANQDDSDFSWVVVDDGSDDKGVLTLQTLNQILGLDLKIIHCRHQGKMPCLAVGWKEMDPLSFSVVVDADEELLSSAISSIRTCVAWSLSRSENIGSIIFRRINRKTNEVISEFENEHNQVWDFGSLLSDHRHQDGYYGYFTSLVKSVRVPAYDGEDYLGPIVVDIQLSESYKHVLSSASIGMTEYLVGGITDKGRVHRLNNPNGMIFLSAIIQDSNVSWVGRWTYRVRAWGYRLNSGMRDCGLTSCESQRLFSLDALIPGALLSAYWTMRYKWRIWKR
jgi:glycosyltransferase involved in cell wall biosynthesis